MSQEGDLRVWNMVNFGHRYVYVKDKEEAMMIVNALTIAHLQDEKFHAMH